MIFDPACKRVRCLFKLRHLFPIVHLSRVEWQVLVPVFTNLIVFLADSYIFCSNFPAILCIIAIANYIAIWWHTFEQKQSICMVVKRDIENKLMYGTILTFIKFINFGTRHSNGPRHLFHSFCCTTRHIFEPLRVYEPGFNTDKYGMPGIINLCFYHSHVYYHIAILIQN